MSWLAVGFIAPIAMEILFNLPRVKTLGKLKRL
jgi:hypothetical protein